MVVVKVVGYMLIGLVLWLGVSKAHFVHPFPTLPLCVQSAKVIFECI